MMMTWFEKRESEDYLLTMKLAYLDVLTKLGINIHRAESLDQGWEGESESGGVEGVRRSRGSLEG